MGEELRVLLPCVRKAQHWQLFPAQFQRYDSLSDLVLAFLQCPFHSQDSLRIAKTSQQPADLNELIKIYAVTELSALNNDAFTLFLFDM